MTTAVSQEEQIATRIAALQTALLEGDCALDPAPGRVISNYYGQSVPADEPCGQLSFRLVSMAPNYQNPAGRVAMKPCAINWWDVAYEVKIVRCVPVVSDQGVAPSPDKIAAAADQIRNDMQQILSTLLAQNWIYAVGPWTPSIALGGGSGGSWTFTFRVDAAPC